MAAHNKTRHLRRSESDDLEKQKALGMAPTGPARLLGLGGVLERFRASDDISPYTEGTMIPEANLKHGCWYEGFLLQERGGQLLAKGFWNAEERLWHIVARYDDKPLDPTIVATQFNVTDSARPTFEPRTLLGG